MTDQEVIEKYNEFIAANPWATRHKIYTSIGVSLPRLERLGCKLPLKVHPSDAARMAKKAGGWGKDFRLRGSPK